MSSLSAVSLPTPQERAADAVHDLLLALGEEPQREGLLRTPERVAKALAFLTSGHSRSARQVLSGAIFEEPYEGLVLVRDIESASLRAEFLASLGRRPGEATPVAAETRPRGF